MALSNVGWKGLKAIDKMLDILPEKLGGQKLRSAYRFALKPTVQKMRENLPPNRTGALWHATDMTIGGTKDINEMFALVGPRRNRTNINLEKIDKEIKEGETVVVPGKVLSQGDVSKKLKVVALNFSEKAKEKLLNAKCEVSNILDEIKKNPQAKNIKVLKK